MTEGVPAPEESKGGAVDEEGGDAPAKKKRNKKKKNKGANADAGLDIPAAQLGQREQDNSVLRMLGNWSPGEWKQTIDFTIPISQ